ncbi:PLP-dependent aminotransferase family protein [Bacillus sp. PS06]|uniref:aminotransferase-like domain-containing protein n=1 Tax=Bacillus sp. PS06 TaxID=2764176 RepID=UPI0017853A53|nr:PLP-dependent aminotransferase family protein [Bacillus sp. PS06]MBD8069369.1 PLP-dependent aminotransferase family protein [Bacillus sp. PS06]
MNEIEWKPTKDANIALHQQIYDFLKSKIMAGEWTVGTRIPTQRSLAQQFEVNRSTIVFALDGLIADGLVETKVGSGTRVINNTWSLLTSTPPPDWKSYVSSGIHKPNISMIQEINRAEANRNFIRLGTGELSPDLLPNAQMKEILQVDDKNDLSLGYTEPKGLVSLRRTVSHYLRSKGIVASPDSILIVSGGLQALQLISIGLLKRGSTILHESPSYLNSVHVFQSAGMNLVGVPMDQEGIKHNEIERVKRQHQAALLYTIPSFHNPTGVLMNEQRRSEVMTVCERASLPIIEDDVYGDLWFEGPPPKPLKEQDTQGNVLYIGSVSKTLSPGLRVGWIVGPEPVIDRLADIKMQTDYGSSSLSQYVVEKWLSSGLYNDFLERVKVELKHRRDFMIQLLHQYFSEIASWSVPKGGFYIWLKFDVEVSTSKLFDLALKEQILLNPGMIYDKNDFEHIRLSYSYASLEQIEVGLIRLAGLIR